MGPAFLADCIWLVIHVLRIRITWFGPVRSGLRRFQLTHSESPVLWGSWDNIFASLLAGLGNKTIAYSNLIQVIKSKTAAGFVPNFAAGGSKSMCVCSHHPRLRPRSPQHDVFIKNGFRSNEIGTGPSRRLGRRRCCSSIRSTRTSG